MCSACSCNVERKAYLNLILSGLFLVSCGPSGFSEPLSSVRAIPRSTYVPPAPQKSRVGNYEYYQGASQVSNLSFSIESATRKSRLQGDLTLQPSDGSEKINIQFDLQGSIDDAYSGLMRPVDKEALARKQIEVGAKLTCLYTDCSDSFVDIYVQHKGIFYHHQVVVQGVQNNLGKTPEPQNGKEAESELDTENEIESDAGEVHTHDDTADGYYIGTKEADLKNLFSEEKPTVTPEPEKESTNKKDDAKKEDKKKAPSTQEPPPEKAAEPKDIGYTGQAIGKPFRGRLAQAVDVLLYTRQHSSPGFRILYPSRGTHYGTNSMLGLLAHMGYFSQKYVNGYVLSVNAISAKNGGYLQGHQSHQTGLDADIAYYFDSNELQTKFASAVVAGKPRKEWMVADQWGLFKYAVKNTSVDRIFIASSLKKSLCEFAKKNGELDNSKTESDAFQTLRRLSPERSHADHFHVRVRQDCPQNEARCFQMVAPPNVTNCGA